MGLQSKKKLRVIVGTLKDTASLLSSAASTSPEASAAVLRATPHHPSSAPAPRRQLDALLAFGRGPRPEAASAVAALLSRLRSTHDAAVALKCLALAHHAARRGSFILRDQLLSALLPPPSGGPRNPLNLSAFRDPAAWALSAWVRWYARVLEQLLFFHRATGALFPDPCDTAACDPPEDRAASLPNADLLRETDALVCLLEETRRAPDAAGGVADSALVAEVARWVREDGAAAETEVVARVREMGERMGCLEFADAVELTCLLRRLEACGVGAAEGGGLLRDVVAVVKEKVAAAMAEEEAEEQRRQQKGALGRVRREKASESVRLGDRVGLLTSAGPVRFGSTRWSDR